MSSKNTEQQGEREQMVETIGALQKYSKAERAAHDLKEQAKEIADPKERDRLVKEALQKEIEARGWSKTARRIQSGVWQGAAGGFGIGTALSVGLGGAVGTLVSGLLTLPFAGLGALIGSGAGAIHGPFIRIGNTDKRWDEAEPEEVVDAIEKEKQYEKSKEESGENAAGDEPKKDPSPAKKPRKIETRSKSTKDAAPQELKTARKPKKLEVRAGS